MKKAILTMNAGSSSLKFGVFCKNELDIILLDKVLNGEVSNLLGNNPKFTLKNHQDKVVEESIFVKKKNDDLYQIATDLILKKINEYDSKISINATSHRVVHGGDEFTKPILIDEKSLNKLKKYIPLAALHQPYNLKIAEFFLTKYKDMKHFACFDTGFHQTINAIDRIYAIPKKYIDEGIKRYGFHGLSYQYIVSKLPEYVGEEQANKKWIIAHLGGGASLCAVSNKKSVATTMGFSVMDGLPMATRCGSIDPAIITFIQKRDNLSPEEIDIILYNKSGLFGLSGGISGDVKILEESNDSKAKFSIEVFCHQIVINIGKMVASMDGCDGIIFTAGIGFNSFNIRKMICDKLSWMNVKIDEIKNKQNTININTENSIPILVIQTNEEYVIAKSAWDLMNNPVTSSS